MKTCVVLFILAPLVAFCQSPTLFANLQLHQDFHREVLTATTEIYSTDRLGWLFFFADFDHDSPGATLNYYEVARYFKIYSLTKFTANATIQYNDGVMSGDVPGLKNIPRAWLGGVALSDFPLGKSSLGLEALARKEFARDLDWQFTAVWFVPIIENRLEFQGVVDWNSHNETGEPNTIQAEPQLQVRRGRLALGSELELSRNFPGAYTEKQGFVYNEWYTHPTIFVRLDL